jgi:hypothetical protein
MRLPRRMTWSVAIATLLAGASLTPATASDGKLVIGAESVRDITREYTDGRKEIFCRVVFKLANKTGKPLYRARFWVKAANGKIESFGLRDSKPKNRENFDKTPCSDVHGKLTLHRARCIWTKGEKHVDCAPQTVIDVK